MHNDTEAHRRRRRRTTVIGLAVAMVVGLAAPALGHPAFSDDGPGFPNPQGSPANPYPAGLRPTLNMFTPFEQEGVIFKGAENTTVDVQVTVPTDWTNPVCGAASTSVDNRQVGTVVPAWTCTIETVSGHQVLHWTGPQISPTQTFTDSAQYFTFQVTVPSPATTTSYGATGSPAEGFYVEQVYADRVTSLWRTPNNTTRPGEVANGIVRTVAGTPTPTPTPPTPTPTPAPPTPTPAPPTPTPTPTVTPVPTSSPGATVTATTLRVFKISLPFGWGSLVFPFATVVPVNAAGIVQFKDGNTNIGGPVRVTGGIVIGPFRILSPGPHSLTAPFTPANPAAFGPATSNTVTFTF